MLDHLALQCADVGAAADFYPRVFAPCGVRELMRYEGPGGAVVGLCGPDNYPAAVARRGRRLRRPARAPGDQGAVPGSGRRGVRLAREAGAEILHEPRIWPEYHPGYYAVFLRDPDGNNVEAVHHTFPA